MRLRTLALVSVLIFVLVSAVFVSEVGASPKRPVVSWPIWQATVKVHNCEEPSWHVHGQTYSGGLGWRHDTWDRFKAPWMPSDMGDATPLEQAWAMAHFVSTMNHGYWPDQFGCTGGY